MALRTAILTAWAVFWVYWLISAFGVKASARPRRIRPPGLVAIAVVVALRAFGNGGLAVDNPVLQAIGTVLFASGLALAVWARIYLGRNWGMPMTEKAEPELVTSGPYHEVRHPIYSGILLAMLGTGLATNLWWLIVAAIVGAYFIYSATVEEKRLTSTFLDTYPPYKASTRMLIPFVL